MDRPAASPTSDDKEDNSLVFHVTFEDGPLGIGLEEDEFRFAAVVSVDEGEAAEKGGVKKGDVIAAVEGDISSTYESALAAIKSKPRPIR